MFRVVSIQNRFRILIGLRQMGMDSSLYEVIIYIVGGHVGTFRVGTILNFKGFLRVVFTV